jgi:lipoate-protein ligase A
MASARAARLRDSAPNLWGVPQPANCSPKMWFHNLGAATWQDANAITCALAALSRGAIVLSRPHPPPLCLGDQVSCEHMVNVKSCRAHGIPIVRSHSRTHALCFTQAQFDLRVILPREHHPLDQQDPETLRIAMTPLLASCREVGIGAEYRAPDEIVAHGRRIARGCQGEMNMCTVACATLALRFDADSFAEMLTAPDENLRSRLIALVRARRTSVQEEMPEVLPSDMLEHIICANLQVTFGELQPGVMDEALLARIRQAPPELSEPGHARRVNGETKGWTVDVGAGTELQQRTCKAPGGFLRATCEWHNHRIVNAMLAGDFLCYPPGLLHRLETALVGVSVGQVAAKVCDFYREVGWITPGILPGHWTQVLMPLSLEDYTPALPANSMAD